MIEEEYGENYAEFAKKAYEMAKIEGWSKEYVFEVLRDPSKLYKKLENRNKDNYPKQLNPVIERMIED